MLRPAWSANLEYTAAPHLHFIEKPGWSILTSAVQVMFLIFPGKFTGTLYDRPPMKTSSPNVSGTFISHALLINEVVAVDTLLVNCIPESGTFKEYFLP